jgi:DNA-binding NarL/FixJ family response regulator
MNMMIISRDEKILSMSRQVARENAFNLEEVNHSTDPLDVMAAVCSHKPAVLILDDDFMNPNSAHTLSSIRKVNENIDIIFITSDEGLEIGREVSPLGIHYYGFKPLETAEFTEAVQSLLKLKLQQH